MWRGVLKLNAVNGTVENGGIDGSHSEVAQCGDLWIPANEHLMVEQKRTRISDKFDTWLEGWSITAQGGNADVIMGRYETPKQDIPPQRQGSNLDMLRKQELEAIIKALVFQLGGTVTMDEMDLAVQSDRALEMSFIQDPRMWKLDLK